MTVRIASTYFRTYYLGFLSWDSSDCHVDLEKELSTLSSLAPKGEESRNGERLVQYASESLVTEVLVHPQVNTLLQCVRNLLSSFTRHRHILHAGYTFAGTGSWILQDGTFSYADLSELFHEPDVQRVLRAYENSVTVDVHCCAEGPWRDASCSAKPFSRYCKVRVNPPDVLTAGSSSIAGFIDYVSEFVQPAALESLLEPSDVVGNIRFSHPTLYVFPGGQGDAALFGINGFNMLVDGGFGRKSCFWDFARHLDRLDAVLLTRLNNANAHGLASLLRRKRNAHVYPQIGHFFCNLQDRKVLTSPDGDKDRDNLLVSLVEEGQEMVLNLRELHLKPSPCYRDSVVEPVNLYHKVGHGKLDMYVVSPARDSKEVKEFLARWTANDAKLFSSHLKKDSRDFQFPLQNMVSICALLVWQPANPQDNITRILFPGSTPQVKIFEGLDKIRHLEYLKHPRCTAKSLSPSPSIVGLNAKTQARKYAPTVLDKITPGEQQKTYSRTVPTSETTKHHVLKTATIPMAGGVPDTKIYRATNTTTSSKSQVITKKVEKVKTEPEKQEKLEKDAASSENKLEENQNNKEEKIKETLRSRSKPRQSSHSKERKVIKSTEKKDSEKKEKREEKASPTTPKKTVESKLNGVTARSESTSRVSSKPRRSPSATPAKSAKEANNRKVAESKTQTTRAVSISRTSLVKTTKKEEIVESVKVKQADKQVVSKRPKPVSPSKTAKVQGSPAKTQSKAVGAKVTSRPSRATDKDVAGKKSKQNDDKDKAVAVSAAENALNSDLEQNNLNNTDPKIVTVSIVDTNVTQEEKQDIPPNGNITGPAQSITSEEDEKKSDGEMRSMEGEDEEDDEYLVIEKEEPYTEESFQEQISAESHLPVPLDDRGVSDDDAEDEKLKRDTQESEKVKEIEKPRKKSEAKLTVQLTDKEHAEQIAKTSTEELEAAERELSLKSTGKIIEDAISPGDKEKLFEEVQGIITSATKLISKKEERASPTEAVEVLKHYDESKSEEKANDRIDDDLKLNEGKLSSEQKEESQPDEKISTTVESGATTAPTLPEDERIPLDNIKEVVEEKHVLEDTKEKETKVLKTNEAPGDCVASSRPGHFHIQGAVSTLHRDIIKTPDEVADLPVDEEYDPSMYSKDDVLKSPSEDASPRKHSVSGVIEAVTAVEKEDEAAHQDVVTQEIEELVQIKEMREILEEAADTAPQGQTNSDLAQPFVAGVNIESEPASVSHEGGLAKECRDEQEKDVDTKEIIDAPVPGESVEMKKASATGLQVEERSDISVSLEELRILGHEVEDIKPYEIKREDAKYSDIEPRNLVEPEVPTKEMGGKPVTIAILHVGESLASEISAVEKESSVVSMVEIPELLEAVQEDVYLESSVEEEPIYGKTDAPTHPEYVTVTPDSSPEGPKSPSEKRKSVSGNGSRKSSAVGTEVDLSKESRRESIRESEVVIGTDSRKSSIGDKGTGSTSSTKIDSRRSSTAEPPHAPLASTAEERRVSSSVPIEEGHDLSKTSKPVSRKASAVGEAGAVTGESEILSPVKKEAENATDDGKSGSVVDPVCKEPSTTDEKSDRPDSPGSKTLSVSVKKEIINTEQETVVSDDETKKGAATDVSEKVCDPRTNEIDTNIPEKAAQAVIEETPSTTVAEAAVVEVDLKKTDNELSASLSKVSEKGSPAESVAPPSPVSRTSPLSPSAVTVNESDVIVDAELKLSQSTSPTKLSEVVSTFTVDADAIKKTSGISDVSTTESVVATHGAPSDLRLGSPSLDQSDAPVEVVDVVADLAQNLSSSQTKGESPNAETLSRRPSAASNKSTASEKEVMSAVDSSSHGVKADPAPILSSMASADATHSLTTSPTKSGTPSAEITSRPTSAASNKSATMEAEITTESEFTTTGILASTETATNGAVLLESVSLTTSPTKSGSPTAEASSRPTSAASNKSIVIENEAISRLQSSSTEVLADHAFTESNAVTSALTEGLSPTKSGSPSAEVTSRPTSATSNKSVAQETEVTSVPNSSSEDYLQDNTIVKSNSVPEEPPGVAVSPAKTGSPTAETTSRPSSAASNKGVAVETEIKSGPNSSSTCHLEDNTFAQTSTVPVDVSQSVELSPTKSGSPTFETSSRPPSAASRKSVTMETEATSVLGLSASSLQAEMTVVTGVTAAPESSQSLTASPTKSGSPPAETTSRPTSAASNKSVTLETVTASVKDSSFTGILADNAVPQSGSVAAEVSTLSSPTKSGTPTAESASRRASVASNKSVALETGAASEVDPSSSGFKADTARVTSGAIVADLLQSQTTSPTKSGSPSAETTSRPTSAASNKSVTLETETAAVKDSSFTGILAVNAVPQSGSVAAEVSTFSAEDVALSPTKSGTPTAESASRRTSVASNKSVALETGAASEVDPSSSGFKADTARVTSGAIVADSSQSQTTSPTKSGSPSAETTSRPTSAASNKSVTFETQAPSGGDLRSSGPLADPSSVQSSTREAYSTQSLDASQKAISPPQCEDTVPSTPVASAKSAGERPPSPEKPSMVQEKQNTDKSPPEFSSLKESPTSSPARKESLVDAPEKQSALAYVSIVDDKFEAKEEKAKPSDDSSEQRTSTTSVSESLASSATHTPLQPVSPISTSPEPPVSVGSGSEHVKVDNLIITSALVNAPDVSEEVTALSLKQQSSETSQTEHLVFEVSSSLTEVPAQVLTSDNSTSDSKLQQALADKETAESTKLRKEAEDTEKQIATRSIEDKSDEAMNAEDSDFDLGATTHPDLSVNISASSAEDEHRSGATTPSILVTGCKTLARQSQPSESDSDMPEEDLQKRHDDVFEVVPTEISAIIRESSEVTFDAKTQPEKSVNKDQEAVAETSILTTTQEFLLSETQNHTDLSTEITGQRSTQDISKTIMSKDQQKSADIRGTSDAVGISSTVFTEIVAVEKAEAATSPMTPIEPVSQSETDARGSEKELVESLTSSETTVVKVSSQAGGDNLLTHTFASTTEGDAVLGDGKEALGSARDVLETHVVTACVETVNNSQLQASSLDEDVRMSSNRESLYSDSTQQSIEGRRGSETENEEPEFTLVSKSVHEEYINVPANENDGECKKLAATTTVSTFTAKDITDSPKHENITKTVTTVTKVTKGDDGADAVETTTTEEVQTEGKVTSVTTKTESSPLHKRSADAEVPAPGTNDSPSYDTILKSGVIKDSSSTTSDSAGIMLQSAVFNVIDGVASSAKHVTDSFEDAMTAGLSVLTSVVGVRKDSLEATRSCTPGSDVELEPSTPRSDVSSGQVSRAPTDYRLESEDEDVAGSPTSLTSQITHSPPPPHFDFDIGDPHRTIAGGLSGIRDDQCVLDSRTSTSQVRRQTIADPMMTSVYSEFLSEPLEELAERQLSETGSLQCTEVTEGGSVSSIAFHSTDPMTTSLIGSLTSADVAGFDQAVEEHRTARGSDLTRSTDSIQSSQREMPSDPKVPVFTASASEAKEEKQASAVTDPVSATLKDPIRDWGKPLGLPSPAPPPTNSAEESAPSPKGTPQKDKLGSRKTVSDNKRRPESPRKSHRVSKGNPIYIDLTYVPHHGNSYYASLEFFKRVRARYYVFSGIEPSREVYNALLEAKQSWEDKDLEVTIIPTYDTDTLGYWVAENEDALAKYKIDLSPSASRCTINLQDHETSCSAYRLEF